MILKKYSIGQINKDLKISINELRKLDKLGLFKAIRTSKNGKRFYSEEQYKYLKDNINNLDDIFYNKYHKLPESAIKIANAINHWVDKDGNIYCIDSRIKHSVRYIKKSFTTNYGYYYCGILYNINGKNKTINKRVHRLVAEAFILNPNGYNVVGHKNNIKTDNRVSNLYWTTISENTQKAVDDGLLINDSGFEDSQSKPVAMFETKTNKLLNEYGSISEAHKQTGISKSTIARQAKYKRPIRKEFYFRYLDDDSAKVEEHFIIGMFDYETDKLLETFINCSQASNQTGFQEKTIAYHINIGRKPKVNNLNVYFKKINTTTE